MVNTTYNDLMMTNSVLMTRVVGLSDLLTAFESHSDGLTLTAFESDIPNIPKIPDWIKIGIRIFRIFGLKKFYKNRKNKNFQKILKNRKFYKSVAHVAHVAQSVAQSIKIRIKIRIKIFL